MSDSNKAYQLNKGAILDGRYEIGRVLGEGGFGITYAGTNTRSGKEVAIKEFFCLDYMGRADDGVSVILTDKSARKRFNSERARFMREARILGEFKDEPGVVTVLDYFETGGTAYLVMEYLSGVTLHDHVKNNGPYKPKVFFEEIRPLMHTLAKVHEAGVIHRDISPDNIMRMDDGNVVLLDFGSAKDLSGKTVTTATTYKDGFAPPEQYSTGKSLGPETDVYALSSTFYYCLTGVKPESSIQRVLLDELRPIHGLAVGIPDDIEKMIEKGMSLRQDERFKTISEMEAIVEARYPLMTPEEKELLRKKKKARRLSLIAAGVIILALLSVHFVRNSTMYKMRMQDTQMVYLGWDKTDTKEAQEEQNASKEIIKKRLAVLTGKNNYIWSDDSSENSTAIEIPSAVLKKNEPSDLFRKYITRPIDTFQIIHCDENCSPAYTYYDESKDEYIEYPVFDLTKKDIEKAEMGESVIATGENSSAKLPYVKIVLKAPKDELSKEFLREKGLLLSFALVKDSDAFFIPCFAEGDGKTLYLVPTESVDIDAFEDILQRASLRDGSEFTESISIEGENFRKVLVYDLSHKSSSVIPGVSAEPSVTWETPDNILAGDKQVSESEIKGKAILTEWALDDYGPEESRSAWINSISAMRERLDALDTPYAFGIATYDERRVVLKIAEKDITQAELLMLETNPNLYIISKTDNTSLYSCHLITVGKENDEHIELSGISSTDTKSLKSLASTAKKEGSKELKLCLDSTGSYPIGSINSRDLNDANIKNGRIPLAWCGGGKDEEDITARDRFVDYVNSSLTEHYNFDCNPKLDRIVIYDSKDKYEEDIAISDISGGFYPECDELVETINKEISADSDNKPGFGAYADVSYGDFTIKIYDGSLTAKNFEKKAVKRAEYLYEKYDLADYGVDVTMAISNSIEADTNDGKVPSYMTRLYFEKLGSYYSDEGKAGDYVLHSYYSVSVAEDGETDADESEEASSLLDELIRKSDILGPIIYEDE